MADVLLELAGTPDPLGVSELARRLDLSKAVVHRIVRSLESRQLVSFDPIRRAYGLGMAAVALGARALRELDLRRVALPVMEELRERTQETVTVSALVGLSRVYLDQLVSPQEIRMTVELGTPFPLHAGASSRVILALSTPDVRRRVFAVPLERLTDLTVLDPNELREQLERIAVSGVAASLGERQAGAASVASPVTGVDGTAVGALSVCGPVDRFDEAVIYELSPLVRDAAERVSAALGAPVAVGGPA